MNLWPLGFRVRPAVDPQRQDVEVADTVTGRRFRWSPEALARFIVEDKERELTEDGNGWAQAMASDDGRKHLAAGWSHWQERAWYPSDQYYVASRRSAYADSTDDDGVIGSATVEQFLSIDGPPPGERPIEGRRIALGTPAAPGDQPLSSLLLSRHSDRDYVPKPVPLERLSGLLWHGLTEVRATRKHTTQADPASYLDSYGSAWDFHLCAYSVAGLPPGTYRYDLLTHELIEVCPGDHREAMIDVLQGLHSPATAAWTLGLVADFPRYQWRYRHEHGLRQLYLEAGILGQEIVILGMSYGLSSLVTPAQKDRPYLTLHGMSDDRYAPIYTLTMGWSRDREILRPVQQPAAVKAL